MRIKKTDKIGTIHELPLQLANLGELDNINPVNVKEKNQYLKILEKNKVFNKNITLAEKKKIVSKIKLINFNEAEIEEQTERLKAINSYNRLVTKKRIEIEEEVMSGKNVKVNMLILKNVDKIELNIPRKIRGLIRVYEKKVKLIKISTKATKNRINYYSGLNYNFLIKDGFTKPYYIYYDKLQELRKKGNLVENLLKTFEKSVNEFYERDKKLLFKSDLKKWNNKVKVYNKLYKVLEHNMQITTNKKYSKKLITRDEDGNIIKEKQEYPILMDIIDELIELYI